MLFMSETIIEDHLDVAGKCAAVEHWLNKTLLSTVTKKSKDYDNLEDSEYRN